MLALVSALLLLLVRCDAAGAWLRADEAAGWAAARTGPARALAQESPRAYASRKSHPVGNTISFVDQGQAEASTASKASGVYFAQGAARGRALGRAQRSSRRPPPWRFAGKLVVASDRLPGPFSYGWADGGSNHGENSQVYGTQAIAMTYLGARAVAGSGTAYTLADGPSAATYNRHSYAPGRGAPTLGSGKSVAFTDRGGTSVAMGGKGDGPAALATGREVAAFARGQYDPELSAPVVTLAQPQLCRVGVVERLNTSAQLLKQAACETGRHGGLQPLRLESGGPPQAAARRRPAAPAARALAQESPRAYSNHTGQDPGGNTDTWVDQGHAEASTASKANGIYFLAGAARGRALGRAQHAAQQPPTAVAALRRQAGHNRGENSQIYGTQAIAMTYLGARAVAGSGTAYTLADGPSAATYNRHSYAPGRGAPTLGSGKSVAFTDRGGTSVAMGGKGDGPAALATGREVAAFARGQHDPELSAPVVTRRPAAPAARALAQESPRAYSNHTGHNRGENSQIYGTQAIAMTYLGARAVAGSGTAYTLADGPSAATYNRHSYAPGRGAPTLGSGKSVAFTDRGGTSVAMGGKGDGPAALATGREVAAFARGQHDPELSAPVVTVGHRGPGDKRPNWPARRALRASARAA
ncbi:hypothetical protein HT031_002907 [Scenedesmus sp. PABB004]|nr:hypothetical protein HT031_002907 [Scenedesmus sp. PABB004]